jgi:hypothetical protein
MPTTAHIAMQQRVARAARGAANREDNPSVPGLMPAELGVANIKTRTIVYGLVKLNWKHARILAVLAAVLPCAGCGGISATKSISPLDFFIPGGLLLQPTPVQLPTNGVVPQPQPDRQLALAQ